MEQLYIQNLPFSLSAWEIKEVLAEAFYRPEKVICLKRGPYQQWRRQSCFAHWRRGFAPPPSAVTGWLPMCLAQKGWNVALEADYVMPLMPRVGPVLWQHFGSKMVKMNHQGSCKGSRVHNVLKIGTYFERGTCACCEIPPTCITCSPQAVFFSILGLEFVCWLPFWMPPTLFSLLTKAFKGKGKGKMSLGCIALFKRHKQ